MIVKNLTSKVQVINVQEFGNAGREYSIYLEPNGYTELIGVFTTNKKDLKGLVEFETFAKPEGVVESPVPQEVTTEVTEDPVEETGVTEDSTEETAEQVEVLDSKFICDECGAEFASSRGLASHKARVHEN